MLPNFLIVGAAKSGTTSLHNYLRQHPQIFMPEVKENFFFSFMGKHPNFISPDPLEPICCRLDDYIKIFEGAQEGQVAGEASPSYLYTYEATIKNLKKVYGQGLQKLRIIIILRNPIDRAWSQYFHFIKHGKEVIAFDKAIHPDTIGSRLSDNWNIFYDYIGFGMYFHQVKAFWDNFSHVKIFFFEDLNRNCSKLIRSIFEFLDVEPSFQPKLSLRYNVSGVPKNHFIYKFLIQPNPLRNAISRTFIRRIISERSRYKIIEYLNAKDLKRPEMNRHTREYLANLYRDDLLKLQKLLNRDLSHWLTLETLTY